MWPLSVSSGGPGFAVAWAGPGARVEVTPLMTAMDLDGASEIVVPETDGRAAGGERLGADDEAASAVCGDGLPCDDEGHCCDLALGGGARAEEHGAAAYYDLGLAVGGLNDDGCALDADGLASGHGL